MDELILPRPDDFHLHARDGDVLFEVLPATARVFGRALLMPNTKPPIITSFDVEAYRERVTAALPANTSFTPLFALYLSDQTDAGDMRAAIGAGLAHAVKYYPRGATTHSDAGLRTLEHMGEILDTLAQRGVPLCVHGEVTDPQIDIFDREAVFIDTVAGPLLEQYPKLRLVFEHATTKEAVDFVKSYPADRVAATITPQHLLLDRNDLFRGGLRPHHYCLPVLKRKHHRAALLDAATSGDPHFFLGTDSAPHAMDAKENACGCAGCYSAPYAMPLYATAFDSVGRLDRLPSFASRFGADFYRLPQASQTIRLRRQDQVVPLQLPFLDTQIIPLWAGNILPWTVDLM